MNYQGKLTGHEKRRIAIIASRFNALVVERLVSGAKEALRLHGIEKNQVDVVWVPGAFEIPLVAKKLGSNKHYDGIVAVGAVIKGQTDHYDLVIQQAASGIGQAGLETGVPTTFGVLTTNTLEEAEQRSGAKAGNEGYDVAVSLLEMIDLFEQLG
ncbi:6,7-dimethyl-8-ribityllumazine synthase [Fructobacillus sp. M2-14]|uniref:6,7-dimethyl-8-ribityllumazine synthase n=1 Tax=Fructobacillus broussonetiae TaxID=2713173 RepID=A0ABS5R0J4_9LACO|nr:6,7-dimethyl-8-ribityllumazine synthase [Fructobacillus broussonetiae]MBS9338146.1 6,7-dimethyl-8-ribityllumazine synthase [Fructobacillus broussonetiae]